MVASSALTSVFPEDYVSFDPALHRITGENYKLGFATPKLWVDYLTLSDGSVDIIDRTPKLRACPTVQASLSANAGGALSRGFLAERSSFRENHAARAAPYVVQAGQDHRNAGGVHKAHFGRRQYGSGMGGRTACHGFLEPRGIRRRHLDQELSLATRIM